MSNEIQHASDCAVHNEPAYPAGPCDCGAVKVQINTGGMAFPGYAPTFGPWFGMNMRDYFAANSGITWSDAVTVASEGGKTIVTGPDIAKMFAHMRFAAADAMIKKREEA